MDEAPRVAELSPEPVRSEAADVGIGLWTVGNSSKVGTVARIAQDSIHTHLAGHTAVLIHVDTSVPDEAREQVEHDAGVDPRARPAGAEGRMRFRAARVRAGTLRRYADSGFRRAPYASTLRSPVLVSDGRRVRLLSGGGRARPRPRHLDHRPRAAGTGVLAARGGGGRRP